MTDKPIIFSAPMVQALLDGRKTQDRRLLKAVDASDALRSSPFSPTGLETIHGRPIRLPYAIGDRLWVKEAWAHDEPCAVQYRAGPHVADDAVGVRWRSPIHMPRWASRLTLTVTDVRVQRLQDISDDDAVAEGVFHRPSDFYAQGVWTHGGSDGWHNPISAYRNLCNSLHGPESWDANQWVEALTFDVQHGNIDRIEGHCK